MIRKQVLLAKAQVDYLAKLKKETGESESHFVREAIEKHRKRSPQHKGPAK